MGQLILVGLVLAAVGAVIGIRDARRRRSLAADAAGGASREGARPGSRHRGLLLVGIGVTVALGALAVVVVRDLERRDRPVPAFAPLSDGPDPSLRGAVAFVVEVKDGDAADQDLETGQTTTRRSACARVVSASGARSRDAYCWSIEEPALATTVWQDDGRLLVTAFDAPVGEERLDPTWAKLVDVATGEAEDVAAADLGEGARPEPGPTADPDGRRLMQEGSDGTVHLFLEGSGGSRTLLQVDDANPDWGVASGPVWSPDFEWVLWWDGARLLLTTVDEPSTRVLAAEAAGGAFSYDVPTFDITERDVLGP